MTDMTTTATPRNTSHALGYIAPRTKTAAAKKPLQCVASLTRNTSHALA